MDDLPHDILAHIFLCSPLALGDKVAISAVSRRLRRAVLEMPLLWSSIEVSDERDLRWFEICILRSQEALLDVSVRPDGRDISTVFQWPLSQLDVGKIVAALLPHVARLRTLAVYLYDLSIMAPLLSANLVFERLAELVVHGRRIWRHHTDEQFPVSLVAPELEVMDFSIAYTRRSMIAPRLRELTLVSTDPNTITQTFSDPLLVNCRETLHKLVLIELDTMHHSEAVNGFWEFPHLQRLDISFPSSRALGILESVRTAHVRHVFVCVKDGIDSGLSDTRQPHPIIAHLLDGMEDIARFTINNGNTFTMVSSRGMLRQLCLVEYRPQDIGSIWACLCDHYNANRTVTACELDTNEQLQWDWYRIAFFDRPPAGPDFVLTIKSHRTLDFLSPLEFPTLAKVVLQGFRSGLYGLKRLLLWLIGRAINCSSSEVQVCICAVTLPGEIGVADPRVALGKWLLEDLPVGGYRSADAARATRWNLCPGNC